VPVETRGSAGETLVFLPGLGCAPDEYWRGLDALSSELRVLAPDLSFRGLPTLPRSIEGYLDLVSRIAEELAPGAPWSGHSFGALLAMLHPGRAIACAPSVPADVALPRTIGRAVWKQTLQCLGFDGRRAVGFGWRTARDYLATAAARPKSLFSITADLKRPPAALPPRSRRAVVYLCRRDELYLPGEYEAWFDGTPQGFEIREVEEGHDWPVTHPERFAERMLQSYRALADD